MRVGVARPLAACIRTAPLSPYYPSKKIFKGVSRRRILEVNDGRLVGVVSNLDFVEDQVLPKQVFDLLRELGLAVDLEAILFAEDDTVGEELSLRREERRRAAGARRELLDVVRDEAVEERSAILAGQDHRAAAGEVEEEGRESHARDSRIRRRACDPCDNGAP